MNFSEEEEIYLCDNIRAYGDKFYIDVDVKSRIYYLCIQEFNDYQKSIKESISPVLGQLQFNRYFDLRDLKFCILETIEYIDKPYKIGDGGFEYYQPEKARLIFEYKYIHDHLKIDENFRFLTFTYNEEFFSGEFRYVLKDKRVL